ncbi:MAG TPA: TonB family protein [Candidatus Acidoferrum sp.]|nr:TonB family protein [Candidatus Acidoferrum sp.]
MGRRYRLWTKFLRRGVLLLLLAPPAHAQESRKIVKEVEPQYPFVLKRMEIGGVVRLKVVVKADGSVQETEVLGGNPILAAAAQKAVAQWKFASAEKTSTVEIKVTFDPHK